MGQVTLSINNRKYHVACDDGEETRLIELSEMLSGRIKELAETAGPAGDTHLLLMAGLMLSDELQEASERGDRLERRLEGYRKGHDSVDEDLDRLYELEDQVVDILDRTANRLEAIAGRLGQT